MSDAQDIQRRIGVMLSHLESMQTTTQEQKQLAAQLLSGIQANIQMLDVLVNAFAARISDLKETPDKLGKLAFTGGAAAVKQALQSELNGLSSTIETATKNALTSALIPLKEQTSNAIKVSDHLAQQAKRFTLKTLGVIGACALGALALCLFTIWVSLAWQRSDNEKLKAENAALSSENEEMKANAERLKSLGGKVEIIDSCKDGQGKMRKCVAIQPTPGIAGYWGTSEKPFYILKGY